MKKSEIISHLNEMANAYRQVVKESFSLFNYDFEVHLTSHFIERFIQRYPTYEVAEGIVKNMLDLFFENKNHLIFSAVGGFKEFKLVNIRYANLQRQNVIVMTVEHINNMFTITFVTIYSKTTSYIIKNPIEYVLLHKKPPFIVQGQIGKKIKKFSENNELPEELKLISKLWN